MNTSELDLYSFKLIEIIDKAESVVDLSVFCKALDNFIPIKYRMLNDKQLVDDGFKKLGE